MHFTMIGQNCTQDISKVGYELTNGAEMQSCICYMCSIGSGDHLCSHDMYVVCFAGACAVNSK